MNVCRLFVDTSRKMAKRSFGKTITLIDATYKTTKYDIALFFLCVKTNMGYAVVAEFVLSSESAHEIAEALSILKN